MAVDISPRGDGGVLKEIIREGVGERTPANGCTVRVHYTGTLVDGTQFDSSRERNSPFTFELGLKNVIRAWDIGVATMKKGEICMLTCAPNYAYGEKGRLPKIPPNATLKFEIELIDWTGEDISPCQDRSIERFKIKPGKGHANPEMSGFSSLVTVELVGMYNEKVFEEREVQFTLGEGEDVGVIEGVELALTHFKAGEKSLLKIKSKYAFKGDGKKEYGIPPDADVEYIVTLKSFEKAGERWSLKPAELIEQAKIIKDKGTKYFTKDKYNLAINMYEKVKSILQDRQSFKEDTVEERDSLLLSIYLNLGLCYLKTDKNIEAKDACNEALKLDPKNEKALFRRGQAYLTLASPDLALKDFEEVLKMVPTNTAAAKQIVVCNKLIKNQLAKEKKLYANMFDKFAKEDKQKEEEKLRDQPDVMRETLGEWGQEERPGGRDATAFEKENPNILMLNANGTGEFQNM